MLLQACRATSAPAGSIMLSDSPILSFCLECLCTPIHRVGVTSSLVSPWALRHLSDMTVTALCHQQPGHASSHCLRPINLQVFVFISAFLQSHEIPRAGLGLFISASPKQWACPLEACAQ